MRKDRADGTGDAERAQGNYQLGLDAVQRQHSAVEAARRSYGHAQTRYKAGDIALTELLAEERILRDVEDAYARIHTATAIDLVALYKALGGGWQTTGTMAPDGASTETGP